MIDSQSVKRAQRGQLEQGFDGYKKVKGRKRHVVVDVLGLMLGCFVSAANVADGKASPAVLVPVLELYKSLEKVLADQAYKGELDSCLQAAYKCVLEIAPPRETLMLSCRVVAMDRRTDFCVVGQCPSAMSRL